MQHSSDTVSPIEKIVSILSYFSMGLAGLVFVIIAYFLKKNIRYFLMYNIAQSMLISILLAIISYLLLLILKIFSLIPFLDMLSAKLFLLFSKKVLSLSIGLSFNIFQFFVFVLIIYICTGIVCGRIFNVPILTNIMKKAMKSYR